MRIIFFAGYFHPHSGGSERYTHQLSKRLVKMGHRVDVVTCNTEKAAEYEVLDGIGVHRLPAWNVLGGTYPVPKPTVKTLRILWRLLREHYDLAGTQTRFFLTSFVGLVFARLKRVPLVHTEHGTTHSVLPNRAFDLISRAYDHTIGSLIVRAARVCAGVSEAACSFLKHLGARETVVIPNGVDTAFFVARETKLRRELGLDEALVITAVGRLIFAKGIHDLISAFAPIRESVGNVKLLIVGSGAYEGELRRLAGDADGKDVFFLGEMDHLRVVDVLSITDVFVNASYSEGLPTCLLEAGAVGLPVVATDVGGTKEIVDNLRTGLLVPAGDPGILAEAVCRLAEDRALREELGRNLNQLVKSKFDWDVIACLFCEVAENVQGRK